jgi:hypothetical protein
MMYMDARFMYTLIPLSDRRTTTAKYCARDPSPRWGFRMTATLLGITLGTARASALVVV